MAIRPKSVIYILAITAAMLVLVSLVGDWVQLSTNKELSPQVAAIIALFDLRLDATVPSFFSVATIALSGCLLTFIANSQQNKRTPLTSYWTTFSFVFFAMAFDKFASIHELFIDPYRSMSEQRVVIFGAIALGLLAIVYVRFLVGLEARTKTLFATAACLYLGGISLFELVEGAIASGPGEQTWSYVAANTAQETMKMFGVIVFLHGLLDYIQRHRIITAILVSAN